MIAPLGAVFVASLLGSLHCAGMCGPLACAATLPRAATPTPLTSGGKTLTHTLNAPASALYHAGRLTAYVTLGAAAGALGSAIDLAGELAGVQRVAGYLAAGLIIVVGVAYLLKSLNLFRPPAVALAQPKKLWAQALSWPAPARAVVVGLLTGLLPCGCCGSSSFPPPARPRRWRARSRSPRSGWAPCRCCCWSPRACPGCWRRSPPVCRRW